MEIGAGTQVGRYTLVSRYATGGMAEIWLAQAAGASGFKKTVVLKILLPKLAIDADCVRMFVNEALVGSALDHPSIVHVFDHGEFGTSYFIAMEYVSGRTLRTIERELRKTGRLPPPWLVLRITSTVCDALEYAYHLCDVDGTPLHLVHRDVTPDNIMVSFQGMVKVLDFGIARIDSGESQTETGILKGKRAYISPEQIVAASEKKPSSDPRSDLFSLGVILYEMLTGSRPFQGENELALLRAIIEKRPTPPRDLAPWIPRPLEVIVFKALEKNPSKRFQSPIEFRTAVEDFLPSLGAYRSDRHIAQLMTELFGEREPMLTTTPASLRFVTTRNQDGVVVVRTEDSSEEISVEDLPGNPSEPIAEELSEARRETVSSKPIPPSAKNAIDDSSGASGRGPIPLNPQSTPLSSSKPHMWDALTRRTRDDSERQEKASHCWDEVLQKTREAKRNEIAESPESQAADPWSKGTGVKAPPVRKKPPEEEAAEKFDEGLTCMRKQDLISACAAWERAVELQPENRLYLSNLRKLQKSMKEKE